MKKGGYQILDLKGLELTTLTLLVGAYAILQNAHSKPILVSGIVIDGEKKNDVFVTPTYDGDGNWLLSGIYGINIQISDDDSIAIVEPTLSPIVEVKVEDLTSVEPLLEKLKSEKIYYVLYTSDSFTTTLLTLYVDQIDDDGATLYLNGVMVDSNGVSHTMSKVEIGSGASFYDSSDALVTLENDAIITILEA